MSSLRQALESAYEESTGSADGEAGGDPGVVEASSAAEPAGGPVSTPEAGTGDPGGVGEGGDGVRAEPSTAAERARDAAGRFAPKGKDKAPAVASTQTKASKPGAPSSTGAIPPTAGGDSLQTQTPAAPAAPSLRAPAGWTPAAQEKWATIPPDIQREIHKREREITVGLQESAPARRFQQEVSQAFEPFRQVAQQLGVQNPITLGLQAAQVATRIATAPPHIAAQEIARLILSRADDMDPALVAKALHRVEQGQGQPGAQQWDPETIIKTAEERAYQRLQNERAQHGTAIKKKEVESFASNPANEFFNDDDVSTRVLGLLRADPNIGLEAAYKEAVWALPRTRAILQQREAAEQAKAREVSTQRARAAAVSVKSNPGGAPVARTKPGTLREQLEEAYDEHTSR